MKNDAECISEMSSQCWGTLECLSTLISHWLRVFLKTVTAFASLQLCFWTALGVLEKVLEKAPRQKSRRMRHLGGSVS